MDFITEITYLISDKYLIRFYVRLSRLSNPAQYFPHEQYFSQFCLSHSALSCCCVQIIILNPNEYHANQYLACNYQNHCSLLGLWAFTYKEAERECYWGVTVWHIKSPVVHPIIIICAVQRRLVVAGCHSIHPHRYTRLNLDLYQCWRIFLHRRQNWNHQNWSLYIYWGVQGQPLPV